MRRTKLGTRGPEVSVIGFGAWAIGGTDWGPTDDWQSRRALATALDDGVTLIDTADVYGRGHSERLIAAVLAERGDLPDAARGSGGRGAAGGRVLVATKAGNDFYHARPVHDRGYGPIRANADRDYIVFAAERSLRRLRRDRLDLLQLHSQPTELLDRDDAWDALALLKRQGKIALAGWSVQSFKETEQCYLLERHADLIDVIQVRYNLLEREAERALLPAALRLGIGVIVRIPLLFGVLTGKFHRGSRFAGDDHRRFNLSREKMARYLEEFERHRWLFAALAGQSMAQVALRFALSHPACHVVIPGGRSPQQVRDNDAAGALGPLPESALARLGVPRGAGPGRVRAQ